MGTGETLPKEPSTTRRWFTLNNHTVVVSLQLIAHAEGCSLDHEASNLVSRRSEAGRLTSSDIKFLPNQHGLEVLDRTFGN